MTSFIFALSIANAGAFNDFTGPVALPGNTASIALHSVEGDIEITVDAEAKAPTLQALDFRPGRACQLEVVKHKRGRTQVHFGPKDQEDASECRAEFALVLPPGMDAKIDLGIGAVDVAQMDGALELGVGHGDVALRSQSGFASVSVAQGDVELIDVSGQLVVDIAKGRVHGQPTGPVRATVGEGAIDLDQLRNQIEADTGVGDILLAYAAVPTGPLNLNAGNGHVVVDLPNGTAVQPQLSSMTGTTSCELPEGDGVQVVAVAGLGSVRVH